MAPNVKKGKKKRGKKGKEDWIESCLLSRFTGNGCIPDDWTRLLLFERPFALAGERSVANTIRIGPRPRFIDPAG